MHKIINKKIVVSALLCMSSSYAMDKCMQQITRWHQVRPFADKVIAYKTTSYYLGRDHGCVLFDAAIKYAYVHPELHNCRRVNPMTMRSYGKFYEMAQLLKNKEVPGNKWLDDSTFEEETFYVRHITAHEARVILRVMRSKEGNFEYFYPFSGFNTQRVIFLLESRVLSQE